MPRLYGGGGGEVIIRIVNFFSSRRRHTRFDCDWSSDVCSSDLEENRADRTDRNTGYFLNLIGLGKFAFTPEKPPDFFKINSIFSSQNQRKILVFELQALLDR